MAKSDRTSEFSFVLKPSPIEGVGVFCTHDIQPGTLLELWGDEGETPAVPAAGSNHEFFHRYGIKERDMVWRPPCFNRMAIGWYLNHSDAPNASTEGDEVHAIRRIQAGEEITIDYRKLEPGLSP